MGDDVVTSLPKLPRRDATGHKGTFGTVAIFGGSCSGNAAMIGAPALSALGALRAGAGLARLVMPRPILEAGILIAPSATGIAFNIDETGAIIPHEAAATFDKVLAQCDAIVVGPGLGMDAGVRALTLRAIQQEAVPLVLDADGLNALSDIREFGLDFRARAVLTPHPGEFRRLAGTLSIHADPVDPATRPLAAQQLGQPFHVRRDGILLGKSALLRPTPVRGHHHRRPLPQGHLDGRQRGADTRVLGDLAVLYGRVEIGADEHPLAGEVEVGHF